MKSVLTSPLAKLVISYLAVAGLVYVDVLPPGATALWAVIAAGYLIWRLILKPFVRPDRRNLGCCRPQRVGSYGRGMMVHSPGCPTTTKFPTPWP